MTVQSPKSKVQRPWAKRKQLRVQTLVCLPPINDDLKVELETAWRTFDNWLYRLVAHLKAKDERPRSSFFKPTDVLIHEIELESVRTRD